MRGDVIVYPLRRYEYGIGEYGVERAIISEWKVLLLRRVENAIIRFILPYNVLRDYGGGVLEAVVDFNISKAVYDKIYIVSLKDRFTSSDILVGDALLS